MKRTVIWLTLLVVTVLLIANIGTALVNANGKTAPDFSLPDLSGSTVRLHDVIRSKKVTVLNFWATWCPPCRAEIPDFIRFYRKYANQGVAVIAVNLQEKSEQVKSFAQSNGMNFPILLDSSNRVGQLYQIYAIPTTFIIDSSGQIRHKIEGSTNLATLEAKVSALLKE